MKEKVLVIALDGATMAVIQGLAASGLMPNLARLMQDGACGELRSTCPPNSAPAWTSFMTGKRPARHGVFDFVQKVPGSYRLKVITSHSVKEEAIWNILDKYGRRSAFINFPITYPPVRINGVMITGMLSPGEASNFIYPLSLRRELEKNIGKYIIDVLPLPYMKKNNIRGFLKGLELMTRRQADAALYLLEQGGWDFFMVLFLGPDRIQHALWPYVEEILADPERKDTCGYHDSIRHYYGYIDALIARILERLAPGTNTIILSDHGFGPLSKKIDLNNWLAQIGLLEFKKSRFALKYLVSFLKSLGVDKNSIKGWSSIFGLDIDERARDLTLSVIDWSRTRVFACLSDALYINLKGRESSGIVQPQDYDKIIDEVIEKLLALKDPASGQKVFHKILKREELRACANPDMLPDLIIEEYDRNYLPVWCSGYRQIGGSVFVDAGWQKGAHRPEGLFIGYGPGINNLSKVENAEIVDILPTILSLLKIPLPEDLDGKVLTDVLK